MRDLGWAAWGLSAVTFAGVVTYYKCRRIERNTRRKYQSAYSTFHEQIGMVKGMYTASFIGEATVVKLVSRALHDRERELGSSRYPADEEDRLVEEVKAHAAQAAHAGRRDFRVV